MDGCHEATMTAKGRSAGTALWQGLPSYANVVLGRIRCRERRRGKSRRGALTVLATSNTTRRDWRRARQREGGPGSGANPSVGGKLGGGNGRTKERHLDPAALVD